MLGRGYCRRTRVEDRRLLVPAARFAKCSQSEARRFSYRDEEGRPLYDVVRTEARHGEEKQFVMRLPGAATGGVGAVRRVLFGLPELLETEPGELVAIAEGEKCAMAVAVLGITATTNPN